MQKIKIVLFLILCLAHSAYAYVDLGIHYSYTSRRIEGAEIVGSGEDSGEAITTTSGAGINWAWYMWEYTALELNYSQSTERLQDNRETSTDDDSVTIKEIDSTVVSVVQGAGIRQSLASRKSTFIPSISVGYAKLIVSGTTKYKLDVSGTEEQITLERDKETFNSGYATFSLKIRITKLMGLTFSARTVMPDFDTSQANNNLTYRAGFSWVF
jgi:hypothetical protein